MTKADEIPISHTLLTIVPLFVLVAQLVLGTEFYFAVLMALTFLFAFYAINQAGGILSISGLCIASLFFKSVGLAQIVKILLGQPGDSNLQMPIETGLVFLVGFAAVFLAATMIKFFPVNVRLVDPITDPKKMFRMAQAAFVITLGISMLWMIVPGGSIIARISSGLTSYLQCCTVLAVAGFAAARLIETKGERILSLWLVAALTYGVMQGAVGASKQGMLEPFLAIALSAVGFGYTKIRRMVAMGLALAVLTTMVVYPLSTIRKTMGSGGLSSNLKSFGQFAMENMTSIEGILAMMETSQEISRDAEYEVHYFGSPMGVIDRFSLIAPADRLIWATSRQGLDGYTTVFQSVDILPRSITGNKVDFRDANYVGHKMGVLHGSDKKTGISVTPMAHAYSMDSFRGIVILFPVLFFGLFSTNNFLGNQMRGNIWSVGAVLLLQHFIPESTIGGLYFYLLRMFIFYLGLYWILALIADQFDKIFFLHKDEGQPETVKIR